MGLRQPEHKEIESWGAVDQRFSKKRKSRQDHNSGYRAPTNHGVVDAWTKDNAAGGIHRPCF
jgi:hypothetical protein